MRESKTSHRVFPTSSLSACEVKNNCCLFERLFKVKKNGVFFLEYIYFVLENFIFLYYAVIFQTGTFKSNGINERFSFN